MPYYDRRYVDSSCSAYPDDRIQWFSPELLLDRQGVVILNILAILGSHDTIRYLETRLKEFGHIVSTERNSTGACCQFAIRKSLLDMTRPMLQNLRLKAHRNKYSCVWRAPKVQSLSEISQAQHVLRQTMQLLHDVIPSPSESAATCHEFLLSCWSHKASNVAGSLLQGIGNVRNMASSCSRCSRA